jgi:hypothetical protein
MKPASSLFAKILAWFFLNMIVVAAALAVFIVFQPDVSLYAIFDQQGTNRLRTAGLLIAHDLSQMPRPNGPTCLPDMQRSTGWISRLCSKTDLAFRQQTENFPNR